jgi:hypothetical protein
MPTATIGIMTPRAPAPMRGPTKAGKQSPRYLQHGLPLYDSASPLAQFSQDTRHRPIARAKQTSR